MKSRNKIAKFLWALEHDWTKRYLQSTARQLAYKVLHIDSTWLTVPKGSGSWDGTIQNNEVPGAAVYLVHSFAMQPSSEVHRLATCDYNGRTITAAIQKDNVCGTQFRPEKSGLVGLAILRGFLAA